MKSCFPKRPPGPAHSRDPCRHQPRFVILTPVLGVIFLLDLPQRMGWLIFGEQYMGLFLAITLCATLSHRSEGTWGHADRVPWYDLVAALGSLVIGLYIFIFYPGMVNSLGEIHPVRVILGC